MIHRVGHKLREQIQRFSGELSTGLGKVASRFVEEMVYGISAGGSVVLTKIARTLEEPIRLHDTHKRLSANLANETIKDEIGQKVLAKGARRIGKDTLLIVDPTDLIKKYAKKMENLAEVMDGSEKKIGNGYWMCEVVGAEVGSSEITPLAQTLWSQKASDFVSENHQVLEVVDKVLRATQKCGVLVYDRGGDRRKLYKHWVPDDSIDFIIRQRGDRNLLYKGRSVNTLCLALSCPMYYNTRLIREKEGEEKAYLIEVGFVPVRLPEHPGRKLYLVVIKGFGKKPLMLLTTRPIRKKRKVLMWVLDAYITRWRVEETIRFIKQSYDLEDIRVLTYRRLQNMTALVLAAAFFSSVWLGTKEKLEILSMHVLKAAKRIFGVPDFRYYALADGIKSIFQRVGKGPMRPGKKRIADSIQLSLPGP